LKSPKYPRVTCILPKNLTGPARGAHGAHMPAMLETTL